MIPRRQTLVCCIALIAWACTSSKGPTPPAVKLDLAAPSDGEAAPADGPTPPTPRRVIVASYSALATRAGIATLEAGGNVFDAFVATTAAEYVVHPGFTSISGPLAALVRDVGTDTIEVLDASYNELRGAPFQPGDPSGKAVLVPGAAAGLAAISQKYGKLPLLTALGPAIALARDGFVIGAYYAASIAARQEVLAASEHGLRTFFRNGRPLAALEPYQLPAPPHYAENADALEVLVRLSRALYGESWLFDPAALDDELGVAARLAPAGAEAFWGKIHDALSPQARASVGSHSSHVIVMDDSGNAITGTNTLMGLPWGDGLFVDGVAINASGRIVPHRPAPGERLPLALSMHLGVREGELLFASGTFSTSLVEAGLQLLVNLIDYEGSASEAVSLPRYGFFPVDAVTGAVDLSKNTLDPRVDAAVVSALAQRGLHFVQDDPYADTGMGIAARRLADGTLEAAAASPGPWLSLSGVVALYEAAAGATGSSGDR